MSPPFVLCHTFKILFEEMTKQEYIIEPRDFAQAKNLLRLNPWSPEEMEIKLRSHLPEYFRSPFWKEQNFPAYGLFTQFNSFKPKSVKVEVERRKQPVNTMMIHCSSCDHDHSANESCRVEDLK